MNKNGVGVMILFNSEELGLGMVAELGVDHIKKASPQKRHHHRRTQLTFMIRGSLAWRFPDGKDLRLRGGEFCVTRPGDKFEVLHEALSPCLVMWVLLNPPSTSSIAGCCFSPDELASMRGVLDGAGRSAVRMSRFMLASLREILDAIKTAGKGKINRLDLCKIRLCLQSACLEGARIMAEGRGLPEGGLAAKVERMVLARPEASLGVKSIADAFNLSPDFFSKKFRGETGMSPADFVRRVKLEESVTMMRDRSKSVTETAHALGFSSSQHFATLFKKYFGKTPKEYKSASSSARKKTM